MENAVFPFDVLELIICATASQSSHADQIDLRNCSLVCKDLVSISRQYIFESVSISLEDEESRARTERLAGILQRQRSIATFIRCISCSSSWDPEQSTLKVYQWEDPVFLPFLQLPDVHSLKLEMWYGNISYDLCSQTFFGFRALLERYLTTGSLKRLKLHGFDDLPLESIVASPSLIHLDVSMCWARPRKSTDISFSKGSMSSLRFAKLHYLRDLSINSLCRCSQLENLDIAWTSLSHENIMALLQSQTSPPFPNLQTLMTRTKIDWGMLCNAAEAAGTYLLPTLKNLHITLFAKDDIELVVSMLHHVESLEELVISHDACCRCYPSDYFPIDMRRIMFKSRRTLKHVSMDWSINDYSEMVPKNICDALEGVQSENMLEDLDFSLSYKLYNSDFYQTSHQWERFADILLQANIGYPQLKKVRILIELGMHAYECLFDVEEDESVRRLWEAPLARLQNTSFFEFSLEVRIIRIDFSILVNR